MQRADLDLRTVRAAARFGVSVGAVSVDLAAAVAQSRAAAARLSQGVRALLRRHKVTLLNGHARLDLEGGRAGARDRVCVRVQLAGGGERVLRAADVLLATGARARPLPGLAHVDPARVWGPREAMTPVRGEGTSTRALSVSISARMSCSLTASHTDTTRSSSSS